MKCTTLPVQLLRTKSKFKTALCCSNAGVQKSTSSRQNEQLEVTVWREGEEVSWGKWRLHTWLTRWLCSVQFEFNRLCVKMMTIFGHWIPRARKGKLNPGRGTYLDITKSSWDHNDGFAVFLFLSHWFTRVLLPSSHLPGGDGITWDCTFTRRDPMAIWPLLPSPAWLVVSCWSEQLGKVPVQTFDLEKAASYCEHLVISYKTLRHQRTFDWRQKGAAGQRRFQPEPVSAFRLQQLNKECYTKAFFSPAQL